MYKIYKQICCCFDHVGMRAKSVPEISLEISGVNAWEGPTKGKYCCMVFKANMYKILSKCTKHGNTNIKYGPKVKNIQEDMQRM